MAKTVSKSQTAYYAQYKSANKAVANRKKKLERQLKLQPGNSVQLKNAIQGARYRRRTPTTPQWSHSMIRAAKLLKEFGSPAPIAFFSNNPKVQQTAQITSRREYHTLPVGKVSFTLGARAHDGTGRLIWA